MRRYLIPNLIVQLLFVDPCLFAQEASPPRENLRTINTQGEATVYVRSDEVIVSLGVETFNASLDEAKADNDARCTKLLKTIKDLGIEDKYIQTDTLNVDIAYKDYGHISHGVEGYFARRGYSITVKDTKVLEDLISSALKNGANRLMGIEYRSTELRKHRDEARKMAIKAAREKAVELAGELEMKVGKPRTITESPSAGYWNYRNWWGWGGNNAWQTQNAAQAAQAGGSGEEAGTTPMGQIAIRAAVNVTFDLE